MQTILRLVQRHFIWKSQFTISIKLNAYFQIIHGHFYNAFTLTTIYCMTVATKINRSQMMHVEQYVAHEMHDYIIFDTFVNRLSCQNPMITTQGIDSNQKCLHQ